MSKWEKLKKSYVTRFPPTKEEEKTIPIYFKEAFAAAKFGTRALFANFKEEPIWVTKAHATWNTFQQMKMLIYQKLLAGSPTTNNLRISTPTPEPPILTKNTSITAPTRGSGITSTIAQYISTGQKLLNRIKKHLRKKTKETKAKKRKITRTLVNPEVIQPKSTNYYYLQKPLLPLPYKRSPVDPEPQPYKQVRFLEYPETCHQSQVRFLHPLYPKESNPHLHLDPAP